VDTNAFFRSCVAEPLFARIPKRIAGDTWSAGITTEELEQFAWVEPAVEVQVRFTEWTKAGVLRHASFEGLGNDSSG
jgi:ATP-dependent DNA ligase